MSLECHCELSYSVLTYAVGSEDVRSTEEPDLRNLLENLFAGADARATRSKRIPALALKPIEDLKFKMREVPFAFGYFQRKVEKLMLHWVRDKIPSLKLSAHEEYDRVGSSLKLPPVTKSGKRNLVEQGDNKIRDEENDEAESKGKRRTGSSKKRSKASKSDESGNEADLEDMQETGGVQILDDDEDEKLHFVAAKKRRKPLKFSREEKNAIREGVEKFGDGNWSLIRDSFPVLHHRAYAKALKVSKSVHPKVICVDAKVVYPSNQGCYHTMLKNGELIEQQIDSEVDVSRHDDEGFPFRKAKLCFSPSGSKSMFARRLWTASEKAAVYNGAAKYGVGRWKAIKEDEEFAEVLTHRTAVQIKVCPFAMLSNRFLVAKTCSLELQDCFRVLKKSGAWVEPPKTTSE